MPLRALDPDGHGFGEEICEWFSMSGVRKGGQENTDSAISAGAVPQPEVCLPPGQQLAGEIRMPTVDINRLKGNFGAAYVSALLSSECLVRPVAADTDVGVDLYCETVEDTDPFLHFWVQVKAGTKQCPVSTNGDVASCSFTRDHLKYWSRQPVPVFAALVPVDWPVLKSPTVYIVNLTSQLLGKVLNRGKTLRSDYTWRPDNRDDVRQFLSERVPATSAQLHCRHGVVAPIPTLRPSYEYGVPDVPVMQFNWQIKEQIRRTAAFSILSLHDTRELNKDRKFRRRLASVVEQFGDGPNWETHMAMALSYHADRGFRRAVERYDDAKRSIAGDLKLQDKATWKQWQERIAKIDVLISKAAQREALE